MAVIVAFFMAVHLKQNCYIYVLD